MDITLGILMGLCIALGGVAIFLIIDTIKVYKELLKIKKSKK